MSAGWQKKTLCTAKWVCGEICRYLIIQREMEARVFLLKALYVHMYYISWLEACVAQLVVKSGHQRLQSPNFYHRASKVCWLKLQKISGVYKSPTVQVFHEWFSSSFLPQSKNMPVRLIGLSKLGVIVGEKVVCFLWWTPWPGCIPAFHPMISGTGSSTHRDPDWD